MKIKAKFSGKCARCSDPIKAGDVIEYDPECKSVMHPECAIDAEDTDASPVKPVQAGTTARYRKPADRTPHQEMEYQRLKAESEHTQFLKDLQTPEQPKKLICVGCSAEFEGKAEYIGLEQKDCICAACFERGVTPKRKPSKAALDAAFRIINDVPKPTTAPAELEWVAERVQKAIDVEAAAIARAHYSVHAKATPKS